MGRKLLFSVAALAIGIAAAETTVRVVAGDLVDTERLRSALKPTHLDQLVRPSADPALYYELRPACEVLFQGQTVRIAADGYLVERGSDAPDALRVAVVGPSTTFGFGVPQEDIFIEDVAAELGRVTERGVRLKNFSVPAYVSTQEARVFERDALPWKPDLLIFFYDHRDAFPVVIDDEPLNMPPELGDNAMHSALWKLAVRTLHQRDVEESRFNGEPVARYESYIIGGPWYDRHVAALLRVGKLAREAGIPVVFVIFDALLRPSKAGAAHHEILHRPLLAAIEPARFHVIDLFDATMRELERTGADTQRAFWLSTEPLNMHPNVAAHAFMAQQVCSAVSATPSLIDAIQRHRAERLRIGE